ncbi:hypothetical protein D9X30_5255 [Cupriavidus sp. U2]|nr:hypothetical protein D9X30_5255 [Cupriavidus sp. U2]
MGGRIRMRPSRCTFPPQLFSGLRRRRCPDRSASSESGSRSSLHPSPSPMALVCDSLPQRGLPLS